MSGKTDPQIVREYLSDMSIEETPELIEAVLRHVETELAAVAATGRLAAEGTACPGIATILAELAARPSVLSTLVTGNVYPTPSSKWQPSSVDKWLDLTSTRPAATITIARSSYPVRCTGCRADWLTS